MESAIPMPKGKHAALIGRGREFSLLSDRRGLGQRVENKIVM
jgi:hypothetical protein